MLMLEKLNIFPKKMVQAADGLSQEDVYEIPWREQTLVVKDYSKSPAFGLKTVCRWQLHRE